MPTPSPSTRQVIDLVADIITPIFNIERTMVMPFNHDRHENVGEHSLALSLLAGALASRLDAQLDTAKIVEYAAVHDIVEVYAGDVPVWDQGEEMRNKAQNEAAALTRIAKVPLAPWIAGKYSEYEQLDTAEKRFVYALDKIYPHLLILIADHHPVRPTWEAYVAREASARVKISQSPLLLPLFDELCQMFRQRPHFFSTPIAPIK
jgi:putative hydrolase of HD superfamily